MLFNQLCLMAIKMLNLITVPLHHFSLTPSHVIGYFLLGISRVLTVLIGKVLWHIWIHRRILKLFGTCCNLL